MARIKNENRAAKAFRRLSIIIALLGVFIPSNADTYVVFGEDGSIGINGLNGLPGSAGGEGESVELFVLGGDDLETTIIGANAGDGGSGGNGSDGSLDNVDGSDGGDGGNGGHAIGSSNILTQGVSPEVNVSARGGYGGDGGRGGEGFFTGVNGIGGNGGSGGDATGIILHEGQNVTGFQFLDFEVSSFGGYGGDAFGVQAHGGDGGAGRGEAALNLSSTSSFQTRLELDIRGGAGGAGIDGADAGHGGQAEVGPVVVEVGDSGAVEARVSVEGGAGGHARGFHALPTGNGGNGASVSLSNEIEFSGNDIEIFQSAIGGNGGNTRTGSVGLAGTAASEFVHDDIHLDGLLTIGTGAIAGDGGDRNHSSGSAGFGADAQAQTTLSTARNIAQSFAEARAGQGGLGKGGALGGVAGNALAVSNLTFTAQNSSDMGTSYANAFGGNAGETRNGNDLQGVQGGQAVANATVVGTGSNHIAAISIAFGGQGGSTDWAGSGYGGHGGESFATSTAEGEGNVSADAAVVGGNGAAGVGTGFHAGDGMEGTVHADAVSTEGGDATAAVVSEGGHGGLGNGGADGGNGAESFLDSNATGSTSGVLTLRQTAHGGTAGSVFGSGRAGLAGDARTDVDFFHDGLEVRVFNRAEGGSGGTSYDEGFASSGGSARTSAHINSTGDATVQLDAIGGEGGATFSIQPGGNGGDAVLESTVVRAQGDATITAVLRSGSNGQTGSGQDGATGTISITGPVFAESSNGGLARVDLQATGADAQQGGATHDITLNNAVDGATSGTLSLNQTAQAGRSDTLIDGQNNRAASAIASIDRVAHVESLQLNNRAFGGHGANTTQGIAATGGSAEAFSVAENSGGDTNSQAQAAGGEGGRAFSNSDAIGGSGGRGTAHSFANSLAPGFDAMAWSSAYSGSAGSSSGELDSIGTQGTDAQSEAIASAVGTGGANAISSSTGGSGSSGTFANLIGVGGNGGASLSVADAIAEDGLAVATSTSQGGSGGRYALQSGTDGSARSFANAISNLTAIAQAESNSLNIIAGTEIDMGRNTSFAVAAAHHSNATAQSSSLGSGMLMQLQSQAHSVGESQAVARSTTAGGPILLEDLQFNLTGATAIVIGLPDTTQIEELLLSNENVATNFDVTGDSNVLGFINLGFGPESSNLINDSLYSSSISAQIDTTQLTNSQNILLGLLDFEIGDSGIDNFNFQIDIEHETVLNLLFDSTMEIEGFFNDNILDFGLISDLVNPDNILDVEISLFTSSPLVNNGFAFRAIFGNSTLGIAAVPLPSGLWLFLTALGALTVRRNRRV